MYSCKQIHIANICLADSRQCCAKLQIVSSARHTKSIGTYEHYTSHKDNNVYKHIGAEIFLHWSKYDDWMVSPTIGYAGGYIYHPTCRQSCPEKCDYQWLVGTEDGWKVDETLMITCGNV